MKAVKGKMRERNKEKKSTEKFKINEKDKRRSKKKLHKTSLKI